MNNEDQEQDNNPGPKTFQPSKKVFDVVRPGKSPASATSRPVISSHKPQVPDDQFVPSANTRLAGNPSEKRPLLDGGKKLAITPLADDAKSEEVTPAVSLPASEGTTAPAVDDKENKLVESQEPLEELLPAHFDDEGHAAAAPLAVQPPAEEEPKEDELPPALAEKPTPEQLAVGQVVKTDDELPSFDTPHPPSDATMSQDDVLAETEAPTLEQAIVSHHKHHTKPWEWLLIFFLIVLLALVALNFLLDAEVLTTELEIPHTNLFK